MGFLLIGAAFAILMWILFFSQPAHSATLARHVQHTMRASVQHHAQRLHRLAVHQLRRHTHGLYARYEPGTVVEHPPGCPRTEFCGCGAAVEVFGHAVRSLWLAANWLRFPRTNPHPGAAVVFGAHHVAVIRQYYGDGTALLYDANSGHHLTRVHRMSIARGRVVQPTGA
jgi:hypothetical protein